MSIVTIQLGQCGNQIGQQWFDTISQHYETASEDSKESIIKQFFRHTSSKPSTLVARSVLIDMEPKVINQSLLAAKQTGRWKYGNNSSCWKHVGSGNNWAFGYTSHGPANEDIIRELVRKEVERADSLQGFFLLHSLAGGTGSGLGSFVTELLRTEYGQTSQIINQVIWPHSSGEVIVQHYNAVLTLNHLYTYSDGIIITENDHLSTICKRLLHVTRPSFEEMNQVVATRLASVLLPSSTLNTSPSPVRSCFRDVGRTLFSHKGYKLSTMLQIPTTATVVKSFNNNTWKYLSSHLLQTLISHSYMEEKLDWSITPESKGFNKSVANLLIARGSDSNNYDASLFTDRRIYGTWTIDPLLVKYNNDIFNGDDRSLCLWSNSQSLCGSLENVLNKSQHMYQYKAYSHHYEKYNVDCNIFKDSFEGLEQVLYNYKTL